MNKEEKVLTRELVDELGLNKVKVITSDMLGGYTSIGDYAFWYCKSLISVTIPNSVTSIGYEAFENCSSLTSIILPISVTSIGASAFGGCSSLTSITIQNGVISIGWHAFSYCSSLKSITIPNSVKSIGYSAFNGCSSLTSIVITNSVISIGVDAFEGCTSLPVEDNLCYADTYLVGAVDKSLSTYTIKEGTKWIGDGAFSGCCSLTSITLPNSIINIRQNAFYGCRKLKYVIIGDKIYETQTVVNGKCKAYKAFNSDLTCRDFQYEEGKIYEIEDVPILCGRGFHACLRLTDVFNYYHGEIGKDMVVHEVELEGVSKKASTDDSKVVAKKITIGKRIL